MNQLSFLTGFRGIAAWWVVFYHVNTHLRQWLPGAICDIIGRGYLAVDFFFVLSGFIISYVYYEAITDINKQQILGFYVKRVARIYPLHLVLLLLYLSIPLAYVLTGRMLPEGNLYTLRSFLLGLLLAHNWGVLNELTWNIPSWSISTELAAYLTFPFVAVASKRLVSHKAILAIAGSAVIAIFAIYHFCDAADIGADIPHLGLFRCLAEFVLGICAYKLYTGRQIRREVGCFILFSGVALSCVVLLNKGSDFLTAPTAFFLFILGSLVCETGLAKLFSKPIFVYLGEISYSTYLVHYFVKDWMKMLFLRDNNISLVWVTAYVMITYAASHLLYTYIERPSRRMALDFGMKLIPRRPIQVTCD